MLIHIYDQLSNSLVFSENTLLKIPYKFEGQEGLKINFDNTNNKFELITNVDLKIEAFTSIRIKFNFSCYLAQMLNFENQNTIDGLNCDISSQMPPFYMK